MVTEAQVWNALEQVNDPEFPLNIVDLGMVYGVALDGATVRVQMTFTSIGCPAIEMIVSDVKAAVAELPAVAQVEVEIVWSPPWTKHKITPRGREILQCFGVGV